MSENLYENRAKYYDILYRDKNYEGEVEFIVEKFEEHAETDSRRLLVLGCGTGNHSKHIQDHGFEVTGLDLYEDMLEHAREKCDGDFRQTNLPEINAAGEYDLILMPFTIINHLPEEKARETLENVKDMLADGGALIFDNGGFSLDEDETVSKPFIETVSKEEDVGRIGQVRDSGENQVTFNSMIFTREGFFVDEHELWNYDDTEIENILEEQGYRYEKNKDGYGTDSPKDHGTAFIAWRS